MESTNNVKEIVKEKYGTIAKESQILQSGCGCGCGSKKIVDYTIVADDYTNLDGYAHEADLGLGCGLPTEFAKIKKGDVVVDLGSGAGNDVFVASKLVGESGKVIGIDMTEEMDELANDNKQKLGIKNVEFKLGEIEDMPLESNSTDVVISNCVLNLVPNKEKSFSEIYRILKTGGHFCVSDIVLEGNLPNKLKKSAEMYAGCISGAVQKSEYLKIIENAGFKNIDVVKSKTIDLPKDMLEKYFEYDQVEEYLNSNVGIYSITVFAEK